MKVVFSTWSVDTTTASCGLEPSCLLYYWLRYEKLWNSVGVDAERLAVVKRARGRGRQAGELSGPPKTYLTDRTRDVIYMYLYVVVV